MIKTKETKDMGNNNNRNQYVISYQMNSTKIIRRRSRKCLVLARVNGCHRARDRSILVFFGENDLRFTCHRIYLLHGRDGVKMNE